MIVIIRLVLPAFLIGLAVGVVLRWLLGSARPWLLLLLAFLPFLLHLGYMLSVAARFGLGGGMLFFLLLALLLALGLWWLGRRFLLRTSLLAAVIPVVLGILYAIMLAAWSVLAFRDTTIFIDPLTYVYFAWGSLFFMGLLLPYSFQGSLDGFFIDEPPDYPDYPTPPDY